MAVASKEPAEEPNSVTLPGSPPNPAMLSRTHSSAAIWSRTPYSPDGVPASSASLGCPANPKDTEPVPQGHYDHAALNERVRVSVRTAAPVASGMKVDHHGELRGRTRALRRENVQVQAVFGPRNPVRPLSLDARVRESGRVPYAYHSRRGRTRSPTKVPRGRSGIRQTRPRLGRTIDEPSDETAVSLNDRVRGLGARRGLYGACRPEDQGDGDDRQSPPLAPGSWSSLGTSLFAFGLPVRPPLGQ